LVSESVASECSASKGGDQCQFCKLHMLLLTPQLSVLGGRAKCT
jgi:hypothetical protein